MHPTLMLTASALLEDVPSDGSWFTGEQSEDCPTQRDASSSSEEGAPSVEDVLLAPEEDANADLKKGVVWEGAFE